MWQSRVEIKHSIAQLTTLPYLKHCNAKLPLRVGLIRTAKMNEYLMSLCSTCMSPTLDGSFALQHFEHCIMVEMYNGIVLNYYPGLPHMYVLYTCNIEGNTCMQVHVWQSRIEIEYYSVAYFERITEFDALWR